MGRKRLEIPTFVRKQIGQNIKHALELEHTAHIKKSRQVLAFSPIRFCTASRIPYTTVSAYIRGERIPNIVDMLEVTRFTGQDFNKLMEGVPTHIELKIMAEEEKNERKAKALLAEGEPIFERVANEIQGYLDKLSGENPLKQFSVPSTEHLDKEEDYDDSE